MLESKLLLRDPEAGAMPGLGLLAGVGLPIGEGESTVLFGYVPLTIMTEALEVHANIGVAAAFGGVLDGEVLPTFAAGVGVPVGGNWMVVAEGLSGAPDGVGDFEWTLRGGAGWDLLPEVLQLSVGAAAVRGGDEWTPVIDLGLVWAW